MDPITIIGIVASSLKLLDVSVTMVQRLSKLGQKDNSDENKIIDRAAKQLKRNGVLLDAQLKDTIIWGAVSISLLGGGYFAVHSSKKILFAPVLTLVINSIGETSKRIGSMVLILKDSEDARKLILISEITRSELQQLTESHKIPDSEVKLMYKKEFKSDGLIPLTTGIMLRIIKLAKCIVRRAPHAGVRDPAVQLPAPTNNPAVQPPAPTNNPAVQNSVRQYPPAAKTS